MNDNNQQKNGFFEQISDYFWYQTKQDDASLVCPKHKVEHTGKNTYSALIDLKLYQKTGEQQYLGRAKKRIFRTVEKLIKDPDHDYFIFFPGRLGRFNNSNSVIDSGACLDALSTFYLEAGEFLTEDERQKIKDTIFKSADTYLKKAVVDKEVTNQRLWGGTGLSKAYQIFKEESWKNSLLASIDKSLNEMSSDGALPYHSYHKEYKIASGINDVTTYYHSRCLGFIFYILENIGEDISVYKDRLVKLADFLVGMHQLDGVKNINLECKPWYWESLYEVASHAFDIHALIKTYQLTQDKIYLKYAKMAYDKLLAHQDADGGITSHTGSLQSNHQCKIFWNGHLIWLQRVLSELPQEDLELINEHKYFADVQVVKFVNKTYSCIIRGAKKPMSLMWGGAIGGGSLLYFGTKESDYKNKIKLSHFSSVNDGSFVFCKKENFISNLKKFVAKYKSEIKAKVFHAYGEARVWRLAAAYQILWRMLIMILNASRGLYSLAWACEVEASKNELSYTFVTSPAKKDGKVLQGVIAKRNYSLSENELRVNEEINIDSKLNKIKYYKIDGAVDFKIETNLKYKESKSKIVFWPSGQGNIKISYSLK